MTTTSAQAPLTFEEYQRLHNVLYSLERGLDEPLGDSCVFYSITGAFLMREHYQRSAAVVCGGGAVMLDSEGSSSISWGERKDDGSWSSTRDRFHAWIECEGWVIDLMAPKYREVMVGATTGSGVRRSQAGIAAPAVARKMLQKPVGLAISRQDLVRMGDCTFTPNPRLTLQVLRTAFELLRPKTLSSWQPTGTGLFPRR